MNAIYLRPMVPLLASYMAGLAAGLLRPGHEGWGIAWILAGALLTFRGLVRRKSCRLAPLLLLGGLGYVALQFWVAPRLPAHHVLRYADQGSVEVVGRVACAPDAQSRRVRLDLEARRLRKGDGPWMPVTGKLKAGIYGADCPPLRQGDTVSLSGKLRSIHNFNNPGGFDYRRFLAFQRIHASISAQDHQVAVLEPSPGDGLLSWSRRSLAGAIEKAVPGEAAAVLKALVIGDRRAIGPELREDFNRAGVGHLLAISGLHIGMIAAGAFLLLGRLLAFIPALLWQARARKIAALLTLVPVVAYGLIAGMSPSTQRAVLMIGAFLLALVGDRDRDPVNLLALAALIILAVYPPGLFTISFQLSFAAVLFILAVMGRVGALAQSPLPLLVRKTALLALVSAAAYAGTLPLAAFHFNLVSLVSLPANLILVPVIGMGVVPLALVSAGLHLCGAGLAHYGFWACGAVLQPALRLIHGFADLPFAALTTVTPTLLEAGALYAVMLSALYLGRRRPARWILAASLLVLAADAGYWAWQRSWHSDLRVTFIDVGQGNAALVEFPGGKCMLVDGGGFYDNRIFDVGKRIVAPVLWWKKIKTIDIMVLSHCNSDHVNGLLYLAEAFRVGEIWTNGTLAGCWGCERLAEIAAAKGIRLPEWADLPRKTTIGGAAVEVLYPPDDYRLRRETDAWRDANNTSLVVKVSLGEQSFLFPGDISRPAEGELVRTAGARLGSTVLLAPHHGSRSSSSAGFLEAVAPRVVVFSAGWQNRFRFPHPVVIERCRRQNCRIYRTDHHGAIWMRTDGCGLEIHPFKPG